MNAGDRPKRRRCLTRPNAAAPPAPDLVGRLFDPDRPDLTWAGDLTYVPTDEGWLYLASVLDLASRQLLGYSMGERHDADLIVAALDAASPPAAESVWVARSSTPTAGRRADSCGRRNTSIARSCDGNEHWSTG